MVRNWEVQLFSANRVLQSGPQASAWFHRCGLLYIGETKRRLGDRFAEHLRSVHDKQLHLQVANHFTSPSHSSDDMSILGLWQCHNDATQRLQEQQLIFCLGTLQ
eukprot:g10987.t1